MVVQDLMQTGEEPNVGATLEKSPTPSFTLLELWQFEAEEDLKVSCTYLTSLQNGMALHKTNRYPDKSKLRRQGNTVV